MNVIILLLFSQWLWAAEGMIVVLEAPLFRTPDSTSPVIQYARKGERIYIHPVVTNKREYPQIQTRKDQDLLKTDDPFLAVKPEVAHYTDQNPYVLTKDNQGRDAWVLREHVHIWYEDQREFSQKDPQPDPTDYRLLEPLPATYPLHRPETLRANFRFSFGSPLTQSYNYTEKIQAESYGYPLEVNASITRRLSSEPSNRFYAGGILSLRTVTSQFTLESRSSREQWNKFGLGGVLSYDPYRSDKHRITLSWAALANPFHQLTVSQSDRDGTQEIRQFLAWNFSSRLAAEWQWLKVTETLDLTMGVWSELESPLNTNSSSGTNRPSWWREDHFSTEYAFSLAGFVGLQSTY